MTLPDIPDAAAMAGMGVAPGVHEDDIDRILAAAWPHLYAAALRVAADIADRRPVGRLYNSELRYLANEAVSS